jgi:hypothetical protein
VKENVFLKNLLIRSLFVSRCFLPGDWDAADVKCAELGEIGQKSNLQPVIEVADVRELQTNVRIEVS